MWESAQERLNSRTRSSRVSQELSPLSGKVRCAVCGHPMKRNVYYNKTRTIQYYGLQCATYKTGAMNCINTKSISGKVLEQKILDELNYIIENYCQTDDITITDIHSEHLRTMERQLSSLQNQLSIAKNRLMKMYKDRLDEIISEPDYLMFRETLSSEEQEISANVAETKKQIEKCRIRCENAENQKSLIEKYTHITILDRCIAEEFIDFIDVSEIWNNGEREINIHWNI